MEMVKRCGGLPLALVVLGGLLATKHTLKKWELVYRNIGSYIRRGKGHEDEQEGISEVLALSYYDLPYQLKPCFLEVIHLQDANKSTATADFSHPRLPLARQTVKVRRLAIYLDQGVNMFIPSKHEKSLPIRSFLYFHELGMRSWEKLKPAFKVSSCSESWTLKYLR